MYLSIFIDSTRHNVGLFEKSYTSVWEMILNYSFHSLSPFSSILSFWNPHKADVELPKFLPEFSNIFIFCGHSFSINVILTNVMFIFAVYTKKMVRDL